MTLRQVLFSCTKGSFSHIQRNYLQRHLFPIVYISDFPLRIFRYRLPNRSGGYNSREAHCYAYPSMKCANWNGLKFRDGWCRHPPTNYEANCQPKVRIQMIVPCHAEALPLLAATAFQMLLWMCLQE